MDNMKPIICNIYSELILHKYKCMIHTRGASAMEQNICITTNNCSITVPPAKSDSDVMFCLQSYDGLLIDRLLVYLSYPQDMISTQVIYRFALAQVDCTN